MLPSAIMLPTALDKQVDRANEPLRQKIELLCPRAIIQCILQVDNYGHNDADAHLTRPPAGHV